MKIGIVGQGFVGSAVYVGFKNYFNVETFDLNKKSTCDSLKTLVENMNTGSILQHASSLLVTVAAFKGYRFAAKAASMRAKGFNVAAAAGSRAVLKLGKMARFAMGGIKGMIVFGAIDWLIGLASKSDKAGIAVRELSVDLDSIRKDIPKMDASELLAQIDKLYVEQGIV